MIKGVKGMPDQLPSECWKWEKLESMIRNHFRLWGYSEIRTPILEPDELFHRAVGETSDVVSKEMYSLRDRNDQVLVLRPEGTAPVVRSLMEHQWMAQREIERVYYIGPYFRYEKPQKGRLRQFHQYGVEFVGAEEAVADAECILLVADLYRQVFRLQETQCLINSMGCQECVPPYKKILVSFLQPKIAQYCEDCQKRLEKNPLRILDCKKEKCRELNQAAPSLLKHLCSKCDAHFARVQEVLRRNQVAFTVDPSIVRGFDYYTRTCFEFTSSHLGAQSSLSGGGRYDGLFQDLGLTKAMPSVGFAGGVERLLIALEAENFWQTVQTQPKLFLCHMGSRASDSLLEIGRQIRAFGVDVHYVVAEKSLKAQLKQSDRLGCLFTLILGDDEMNSGQGQLKDMKLGQQKSVSLKNFSWAKDLL